MKKLRRAFTVVEVLIAIAIIGMLLALMMVAVQQSREFARKSQCTNNLRQHGIAFAAYDSQHGRFPGGFSLVITGPIAESKWRAWNYMADILPHLGVAPNGIGIDREVMFCDDRNRSVIGQSFPIGICPSTPGREPIVDSYFVPSLVIPGPAREQLPAEFIEDLDARYSAHYSAAVSDYSVLVGTDVATASRLGYEISTRHIYLPSMFPLPIAGLDDLVAKVAPILTGPTTVTLSRGLRAAEITDGLSNTLLMVEIAGRPQHWQGGLRHIDDEPIDRPWADPRAIQVLEGDKLVQADNKLGLYGFHPSVVNVLFADGHVQSMAHDVDEKLVLVAMTPDRGD